MEEISDSAQAVGKQVVSPQVRFAPSQSCFAPGQRSFRPNLKSFRPNFKVVSFKVICDVFRNY